MSAGGLHQEFHQSENGRDFARASFLIGAFLVCGIALNCLAIARLCAGGEAFPF